MLLILYKRFSDRQGHDIWVINVGVENRLYFYLFFCCECNPQKGKQTKFSPLTQFLFFSLYVLSSVMFIWCMTATIAHMMKTFCRMNNAFTAFHIQVCGIFVSPVNSQSCLYCCNEGVYASQLCLNIKYQLSHRKMPLSLPSHFLMIYKHNLLNCGVFHQSFLLWIMIPHRSFCKARCSNIYSHTVSLTIVDADPELRLIWL